MKQVTYSLKKLLFLRFWKLPLVKQQWSIQQLLLNKKKKESTYVSHFSQILQHEANDLCSSCIDVFIPHKSNIVGESLYISGDKQHMYMELNEKKKYKWN